MYPCRHDLTACHRKLDVDCQPHTEKWLGGRGRLHQTPEMRGSANTPVPDLPLSLFRELCVLAVEYYRLTPWKYLSDSDMLAIEDVGKLRLVSVMGNAGQVFGLRISRGKKGLRWAFTLCFGRPGIDIHDPNFVFGQDGLMLEFVPRKKLEKHDLERFKHIDFKPLRNTQNSQQVWPMFRSIRPGFCPLPLTEEEGMLLLTDMAKTIKFVQLVEKDPGILRQEYATVAFYPSDPDFTGPLQKRDIEWRQLTLGPEPLPIPVKLSAKEIKELMAFPIDENLSFELDCLYSPSLVAGDPYAYFPWLSLTVDGRVGKILEMELTDSRTEKPEEGVVRCFLRAIRKLGKRPRDLAVRREPMAAGISLVCEALAIMYFKVSCLPMTDLAYADLRLHMKNP